MAREMREWGVALGIFVASAVLGAFAAPGLGFVSARLLLQSSSGPGDNDDDCDCGCPPDEPHDGNCGGDDSEEGDMPDLEPKATGNGMHFVTGEVRHASRDLESKGFSGWGVTREFLVREDSPEGPGADAGAFGAGWRVSEWARLTDRGGRVYAVVGSRHSAIFDDNGGGSYTGRHTYRQTLTEDVGTQTRTLTDTAGQKTRYQSPLGTYPGVVVEFRDVAGNVTSYTRGTGAYDLGKVLEVFRSHTAGGVTTAESWVYTYLDQTSPTPGRVGTAVLRRQVNGGAWGVVRQAEYSYYWGSPNGVSGQLARVKIKDGAGRVLETKYYRYYTTGAQAGLLKLVVEGASYERLLAAVGGTEAGVEGATDAVVGAYAQRYFEYDEGKRLTLQRVQGDGCSCAGQGGLGTYTYSYLEGPGAGYTDWKRRVIETLPDGNQIWRYVNFRGHPVLEVWKESSTGREWRTYHAYDLGAGGRPLWKAYPSAVTGYTEAAADLGVTFSASTGYFEGFTYHVSGAAPGYLAARRVKEGSAGTWVTVESVGYTSRTNSEGVTIHPVAGRTRYRNTDGTGGQTTSLSYTWQGTTNRMVSRVTSAPAVPVGQNGSGTSVTVEEQFEGYGRVTWVKDGEGFIHAREYDLGTGAVTKEMRDVDTGLVGNEPSGWVTPGGGGLHLVWTFEVDGLGRVTKATDPEGHITYTVYKDAEREVRVYGGWNGAQGRPTGPTRVRREDWGRRYVEELEMSAAPALDGSGRPTGAEGVSNVEGLVRTFVDLGGRPEYRDSYFSFSGLTYTTGTTLGTVGVHFYRERYGYDARGRRARYEDWTGTIWRVVYDARGRVGSEWVGTDDVPTSGDWSPTNTSGTNLIKVREYEYDGGGVGDGNLTRSRHYTSATVSLETVFQYDFRSRRTQERGPDKVAVKRTYDNLGQVTVEETYADADQNFVIGGTELRGKRERKFDERGRVYQEIVHHVNPSTGAVGNRLTTNFWYSGRGLLVKERDPNGLFRKSAYDGAGRVTARFISYDDAETGYGEADDVAGDTVVEEEAISYDAGSNVILVTRYERTNTSTKTGALSVSWAETDSRRTYVARWYDLADRLVAEADYGRNGGAALSRPASPPAPNSSDGYIVTAYEYNSGGHLYRVTDNKGRITEREFDLLGRESKRIENRVDGTPGETELATDRVTERVYDSAGRLWKLVAKNPKGAGQGVEDQVTQYVYGTDANQASPAVFRNDVLVAEIYPDSDDTYNAGGAAGAKLGNGADAVYDRVEYTYDYASRRATRKDQTGTVRTFAYDGAGRLLSDAVTTLASGVDGAIRRIEYAYDDLSRVLSVSSYDLASGGTLRNQVRYTYDGWGNETRCEQGHEGTATGAPSFQRGFAEGAVSGEARYVRLASMTYPNGRVVYVNYPTSGVGEKLSRPDNLAHDASGTLKFAQMTYLGVGAVVKTARPQVSGGLNLDYGTGTGAPSGWDDFGRIVDQKWQSDGGGVKDRYQYGYDRTSARTFRDNLTATGKDHHFSYDGLDRLTVAKQGDLNAGRTDVVGTPVFREDWELEALGNWRRLVQGSGGVTTLDQTRTHTKANEVTTIGATVGTNWGDGVVDRAGFMTRVPKPGNEGQRWRLTPDGWGRLVRVVNDADGATVAEYKYDGLHRRTVKLKRNGANWDRRDYYYSPDWQVVEERELLNTASKTTVATTPKYQWVWGTRYIDEVVLRDENKDGDGDCVDGTDQRLYVTQDGNWNVTGLVDVGGNVVERVLYDAYGRHQLWNGSWSATQGGTVYANEVLYAGYRLDPESGLYQVRFRHYHPTLGRWMQRDTIGYEDGTNLYEYVRSGPSRNVDPLGMATLGPSPFRQQDKKGKGKDCPTGTVPCPKQGYTPKPNGCGTNDFPGKFVPDKPLVGADFTPACDAHDICYGTCGKSKEECDQKFLNDMNDICQKSAPPVPPKPVKPINPTIEQSLKYAVDLANWRTAALANQGWLVTCFGIAQHYFNAVSFKGHDAYKRAQEEACDCCPAFICGGTPPSPL